jgi:predicted RNA-binding protein with PIN domain
MRWLIDGYNLMHAAGMLGPKLGREGFRRARRRFLDEVAEILPVERTGEVTVVFDAKVPPGDFPVASTYRGLRLIFALGDEDADSRIEYIIGKDSNPGTLTVVSSDRRIRQAASRRRAKPLTADAFWDQKDHLAGLTRPRVESESEADRDGETDPAEAAFWVEAFRDVDGFPGIRDIRSPSTQMLTDAEIAEIQRLIDRET